MNAAELAQPFAENLVMTGALDQSDSSRDEQDAIIELEKLAHGMGLLDRPYFVMSGKSVIAPVSFDRDEPVRTIHFDALQFRGELKTFSTVRMRSLLGRQSIRALCLTFDNVRLLPYFDDMEHDHLLHVPAFAVQAIDKIAA